jgi:hypothetical protein
MSKTTKNRELDQLAFVILRGQRQMTLAGISNVLVHQDMATLKSWDYVYRSDIERRQPHLPGRPAKHDKTGRGKGGTDAPGF